MRVQKGDTPFLFLVIHYYLKNQSYLDILG
jgi:hypothetical protein